MKRRLNPVLARELTERVRSPRAAVVIMVYLLALTGILKLTSDIATREFGFTSQCIGPGCPPPSLTLTGSLGRPIVHMVLFFSLLLVCLIVPALTGGAIAGERERQTLQSLQVTLLKPRSIVAGKLGASLAFVFLLIVASLPLLSTAFWVGGVAIGEVVKGTLMVLVTAVVLASLGIMCSALVRGSRSGTVLAYGLMFVLTVGTFAIYGLSALSPSGQPPDPWLGWLVTNPFVATADVVSGQAGAGFTYPTPFTSLQGLLERHSPGGRFGGAPAGGPPFFWAASLVMFSGMAAAAVWVAARKLETPVRKL